MAVNHRELLEQIYENVKSRDVDRDFSSLDAEINDYVREIVGSAASGNKAVLTVAITLLSHKVLHPDQDIRFHQSSLKGGFSGRTVDTSYVTPFMKDTGFPAMKESGWLTRSLEQPAPYTLGYAGRITPRGLKESFLKTVDAVQVHGADPLEILSYIIALLIKQRDTVNVDLAKPHGRSIAQIIQILAKHFEFRYSGSGAARMPTLAVYAAYQCMMGQVSRYSGKILCPLESHNSADARSGRIGDIDVNTEANGTETAFEGVEVKHMIPITQQLVMDAYEKFKGQQTNRYYILTTANMDSADWDAINAAIRRISEIHGCEVIVNGVYTTLKYYLRLLSNTDEFIDRYVELLKYDESVKYQHKKAWNDIVAGGLLS